MSTPVHQIVKKAFSPRILKSPNSLEFLNPSKLFSDDFNILKVSPKNTKNKTEQFQIHKPDKIKDLNKKEYIHVKQNKNFLSIPNQNYIPSLNTPEREELLKSDLTNLNLNVLGRGSFGTVVQAMYKGKTVALKIIQRKNTSLALEKNAVNLEHPNILPVLLVTSDEQIGRHFVIMENCSAPDLQNVLDNFEKIIPLAKYCKWISDVSLGLQYCHNRGILHLDVKPKNILLKNDSCILCDFGSSLNLNSPEQTEYYLKEIQITGSGTVAYSAPELLKGVSLPTPAADVYAIGITMCHLHTRKLPYQHLDHTHILIYQVVKNGLRPEATIPKISKHFSNNCKYELLFRELYVSCWADRPIERPTLYSVLSSLQQILKEHRKCSV